MLIAAGIGTYGKAPGMKDMMKLAMDPDFRSSLQEMKTEIANAGVDLENPVSIYLYSSEQRLKPSTGVYEDANGWLSGSRGRRKGMVPVVEIVGSRDSGMADPFPRTFAFYHHDHLSCNKLVAGSKHCTLRLRAIQWK